MCYLPRRAIVPKSQASKTRLFACGLSSADQELDIRRHAHRPRNIHPTHGAPSRSIDRSRNPVRDRRAMRMEHGQRQEWSLVHPDAEAARLKLACVLTEFEAPMQRIASDGSGASPRLGRSGLVSGEDSGIQSRPERQILSSYRACSSRKRGARLKIPLIAFGQGHLLAAREALRVGDHFGGRRRRTRLIFFARRREWQARHVSSSTPDPLSSHDGDGPA